jgi:PadR family transcriptional regulator PadR
MGLTNSAGLCRLPSMDAREPRLTQHSLTVLKLFADNPGDRLSGAEVMRLTRLLSGTLYPILLRFEECGLLESVWEEGSPQALGRPRKRLYAITPKGADLCRAVISDLMMSRRITGMVPRPA